MSSRTRKSNPDRLALVAPFITRLSKQIPIGTVALAMALGIAPASSGGSFTAEAVIPGARVTPNWAEKIREAIRRAHDKLHQRNYSMAGTTVDQALTYLMEDYLAYGFDPSLTGAELLAAQQDITDIFCLLQAPEAECDPDVADAFFALAPAMIVDVGGSAAQLVCN